MVVVEQAQHYMLKRVEQEIRDGSANNRLFFNYRKEVITSLIIVRDKNQIELAELDKACNVSVERRANEVWQVSFSLPKNDPKNEHCSHMNYIEVTSPSGRYMGLYRIMPRHTKKNSSEDEITYKCEHVFATLLDDVMNNYHQYTNYTTKEVLQRILNLQSVKHWKLGVVDFTRYFHYSFENENGLLAPILSIPKPFNEPYEFTFNTQVYPWELNLVRPSNEVISDIKWGRDMISFDEVSDPTKIVNVIIPKGAGEGVNKLTIKDVNNGVEYLKDDASIAKWGRITKIWPDERFENAQSLKDNALALLNQWKEPTISFEVGSADLSIRGEGEQKLLNSVTNIIVEDKEHQARIIGETIPDLSKEYDVKYDINNKLDDIATTQMDIERRQQVNEAYSQGATNILPFGYQDNADSVIPALVTIYVDDDVFNINTCELSYRTKKFRAYSETTKSAGEVVKTSTTGGGGGVVKALTTQSGGASQETSSGGGAHRHGVFWYDSNVGVAPDASWWGKYYAPRAADGSASGLIYIPGAGGDIYTAEEAGYHTHTYTTPPHVHEASFTLEPHTHPLQFTIPGHVHGVEHKIIELNEMPTSVSIKVDGNAVPHTNLTGDRINIAPYLSKDTSGKITRGRHEIEILPNGRARIEADVILRVFIRSHIGGTY